MAGVWQAGCGLPALSVRTALQSCLCSTPDIRSFHMGLALFALSAFSQPLHAFVHWLQPSRCTDDSHSAVPAVRIVSNAPEGLSSCAVPGASEKSRPHFQPPAFVAGTAVSVPASPHRHAPGRVHSAPSGSSGPTTASHHGARRPVRVLHAASRPEVGRMVIAGRMADVCAELERMTACETWRH